GLQHRSPAFPAGLSLTPGVHPFPTRCVSGLMGATPPDAEVRVDQKVDSQLLLTLGFLTFFAEANPMKATEREQKIDELWADVAMPVQNFILNATNLVARENARHRDSAFWLEVGKGWVEIRDEALRRAE